MGLSTSIDRARRLHFVWGFIPTWVKVAILSVTSAVLGFWDGIPLQASFMLLLGTAAFGAIGVSMITDAIERRLQPEEKSRMLLESLGVLRLGYIALERDFIAHDGKEELWNQQTRLHNVSHEVITRELGIDYYSAFKDVKEKPVIIPASFPTTDYEKLNLLYLIHGRSEWLGRTIEGLRATAPAKRQQS
jgi:hypothetical protein